MAKRSRTYSHIPISKVDGKLFSYDVSKNNSGKVYYETCEKCGHKFTFTNKDVKDRTFKCPECGYVMAFFYFKYN